MIVPPPEAVAMIGGSLERMFYDAPADDWLLEPAVIRLS